MLDPPAAQLMSTTLPYKKRLNECNTTRSNFVAGNKACMEKEIADVAICWANQAEELEKIKAGGCVTFTANSAKAVANKKNACLQTFVACKQKEDMAVEHSANCTEGTVKSVAEINKNTIFTKEETRSDSDPRDDDEDVDEDDFMDD